MEFGSGEEVLLEPITIFCLLSYHPMPWFSVACNQIIPPDSNLSSPCSIHTYLVMVHLLFPPNPSSPAELALLEPILNSSNETFVQIWLLFCPLKLYLNINLECFKSESTWLPCANLNKLFNKNWGLTSKIDVKWFWLQNFLSSY